MFVPGISYDDQDAAIVAAVVAPLLRPAARERRRWPVRPPRRLAAAADRLRAGDLSARGELRTAGEMDELGRGFDEMAVALDARDRVLRDQAELLDLAATMIYVCDPNGRVP